jgi:glycosyltransferase involved in cell wall biosynthesis
MNLEFQSSAKLKPAFSMTQKQSAPPKILHIVGDSRFGGAAKIILGLGRIAQEEGWQADVLTTDPVFQESVRAQELRPVGLDVLRREIRPTWDLIGLLRLSDFLRREQYNLVHTHTSKGGFVGRLAGRLAGVPIIVHTIHGFAFHEDSPASTRFAYSSLEKLASRWCDRIVSVSEFHRDWAIRLGICGPDRITAIPNGIVPPTRRLAVPEAELRHELGAGPNDVLVLSISRLAADKGLEYLIKAAAGLPTTGLRIQISIAGDGPSRSKLIQLAQELGVIGRVRFVGFREDIGDLLAVSDIVVLPSLREGLSISLLEAMAAGKPIIATSIGSQREVATHGEMAWLVPPADAKALENSILRLSEDPGRMARLARNARVIYERHYTEKRMLDSYRQLYFELLGASRGMEDIPVQQVDSTHSMN